MTGYGDYSAIVSGGTGKRTVIVTCAASGRDIFAKMKGRTL